MDFFNFYTGKCFNAYEYLGCHVEQEGAVFRTFAPSASEIFLIGDFNQWIPQPMHRIYDRNFWECYIPNAKPGQMYKYRIKGADGRVIDHCDPYGFGMELRPQNASIIRDLSNFHFHDDEWMKYRTDCKEKPLNIYELHAGSWKENPSNPNGWYSYSELADLLIPYVKEYGYNYVELLPISEHPSDKSWGYQNTGFYSPTSRYGTADDLRIFIDKCHQNYIGVILDFVPVHFAIDDYALANYDGQALYEYPHEHVGNSEWGSKNFCHSRGEVRSFLQSSANYWLKEYHVDGLRVDALSNLIYWQGDAKRGVNGNTIEFIKVMNHWLKEQYPTAMLIAEDSTAFPNVTKPTTQGGLGFDYKWNMGWMHDTLEFFQTDFKCRTEDYHKLTFSMVYYYNEAFLLPLSHDEVVHKKDTIAQKMYGKYDGKFPQARALYMYMYAHPGKKLNFMGNELAQLREWDENREQDWEILKYPLHDSFHRFMRDLNRVYLAHSALWAWDFDKQGFQWLQCNEEEKCFYAFERISKDSKILAVFNFSDKPQPNCLVRLQNCQKLELILSSNADIYSGSAHYELKETHSVTQGQAIFHLEPFEARYYFELPY